MATDMKYYCGVTLDVGGTEVNLNPSTAISDIKTEGLECSLPSSVSLGQVSDLFDSVVSSFGGSYTYSEVTEACEGIPGLSTLVDLIGDAALVIEQLDLKIPATHEYDTDGTTLVALSETGDTEFTVAMSLIWEGDAGTLFGDIAIKGLYFKVSNQAIVS